jgi:hypothetical protein
MVDRALRSTMPSNHQVDAEKHLSSRFNSVATSAPLYNSRVELVHRTLWLALEALMIRRGYVVSVILLLLVIVGCGSHARELQSMSISPATGSGQVQFVATGHYNQAPFTMSPLPALWVLYLTGGKSGATITQDGTAACDPGVSGTFWIIVYAPADPQIPIDKIATAKKVVVATAVINCPWAPHPC